MTGSPPWRDVDRLFQAALDIPPDRRLPFLEEACGSDIELFQRVTDLLEEAGRAPDLTGPGGALIRAAWSNLGRFGDTRPADDPRPPPTEPSTPDPA